MKTLIRKAATLACTTMALLTASSAQANNIQVTNPMLTNGTGGNATIQFDLSWENSWRGGGVSNLDAAWVFVKYYSGNAWHHALLNNFGILPASGCGLEPSLLSPMDPGGYNASSNPIVGFFVTRDTDGNGSVTFTGNQVSWNYGAQGLAFNDISKIQVFAIEMVMINTGPFAAGSGGTEDVAFTLTTINTFNPTTSPSGTGSLGGQAGGFPTGQTSPTNASWPNGFLNVFCMKYEVSQQGYVDFLNTLNYSQQATRTSTAPNSTAGTGAMDATNQYRNGIDIETPGVASTTPAVYSCNLNGNNIYGEATDGKDLACNFLSWGDLTAYLDWSCLRPMTELEFEKFSRGPVDPLPNEYPWGTTGIAGTSYTLANGGANNEGIAANYSTSTGNANFVSTNSGSIGPLRGGIFAANPNNSGRVTAGASYYGIMELGGNLWERSVTIGNTNGRAFTGSHGNGGLTAGGDADTPSWPLTNADGTGFRGGAFDVGSTVLRVSDRYRATDISGYRGATYGGRGVRF